MCSLALSSLKEDIKLLERLFLRKLNSSSSLSSSLACTSKDDPKTTTTTNNSNCFRLITASVDELVCEFIDTKNKKYRINANLCVNIELISCDR